MFNRRPPEGIPAGITAHAQPVIPEWIEHLSPTVWLPPSSITGVADGGAVTTWTDYTGNSNDPTQATAGKKPLYRATGGPNGGPAVEFDGIDDYLKDTWVWAQPIHLFVVARCLTAPTDGDTLFDGAAAANTMRFLAWNGNWAILAGGTFVESSAVDTEWHLFEMQWNGASSKLGVDDIALVTGNAGAGAPGGLVLGLLSDLSSSPADCRFAEFLGFSAILGASDRTSVRTHLQDKFGL